MYKNSCVTKPTTRTRCQSHVIATKHMSKYNSDHWIQAITTNNCQPYKKYRRMQTTNKKLKTPSSQGIKCQATKRASLKVLLCHHNILQQQAVSALYCQMHMAWQCTYNVPQFSIGFKSGGFGGQTIRVLVTNPNVRNCVVAFAA